MTEANLKYLEAMKEEENEDGEFRLCEVAERLGFSRPGVSKAASRLFEDGYIVKTDNGRYRLTENGRTKLQFYEVCIKKIADILKEKLNLKENLSRHDAFKIVGGVSCETLKKIYEL